MNKFKIGDRVRFIADPLPSFQHDPGIVEVMNKIVSEAFAEKTVFSITGYRGHNHKWLSLSIDKDSWAWDERWLVLADEGPKRDARGRFIKKEAAEAPKKEEKPVEKAEAAIPKETVRDELTEKVGDQAGTCSYAIQYEKETVFQVRDGCHARLQAWQQGEHGKPLYAALNMKGHFFLKTAQWKEFFPKFLKWALNESSFKNCFITKCEKEAIEKGILLNMKEMNSRVVAAAIFLRSLTEYPHTSILMEKLVDKGVPYAIAWMISQGVRDNQLKGYAGGHHCIIGTMPFDVLKNGILNNKPLPDIKEKSFEEFPGHYKIFKAVCGLDLYYYMVKPEAGRKTLTDFMKEFGKKAGDAWGVNATVYTDLDLLKIAVAMTE